MSFILLAALAVHVHLVLCVLLPGVAARMAVRHWMPFTQRPSTFFVESLALGFLFASAQFLILRSIVVFTSCSTQLLLVSKYLCDLLFVVLTAWFCRRELTTVGSLLASAGRALLRPDNLTGAVLAVLIGGYSIVQFPYANDNAALYWLSVAARDQNFTFASSQGSLAYVAWLYWPAQLFWPSLAASTLGATAKLTLHLAAFFVLKRVFLLWPPLAATRMPFVLYLASFTTFMGFYGLIDTGKETPFGILFLFAFFASLVAGDESGSDRSKNTEAACFLSLAFGFGAITIPYAAAFLVIYLLLRTSTSPVSHLSKNICLLVALPLSFSLSTMLQKPFWFGLGAVTALTGIVWLTAAVSDRLFARLTKFSRHHHRLLEIVFVAGTITATWLLFPLTYPLLNLAPFDGKTSFYGIFFAFHPDVAPPWTGILGMIGIAVALVRSTTIRQAPLLSAFFGFPFAALCAPALLAHFPGLPIAIHPQNLWDLAKDIPNWCWGVTASFSALILLVTVTDHISSFIRRSLDSRGQASSVLRAATSRTSLFSLAVIICAACFVEPGYARRIFRWDQPAMFCERVAHRSVGLALFADAIISKMQQVKKDGVAPLPRLYCTWNPNERENFNYYGKRNDYAALVGCGIPSPTLIESAAFSSPNFQGGFILADEGLLPQWWLQYKPNLLVTELARDEFQAILYYCEPVTKARAALCIQPTPPFKLFKPDWRGLLAGRPPVVWDALAASKPITRNGKTYLWGRPDGTLWVSIPDSAPESGVIFVKAGFQGNEPARLVISSPCFDGTATLDPSKRSISIPLKTAYRQELKRFHQREWFPIQFKHEGAVNDSHSPRPAKAYRLESFAAFGFDYLE